MTTTPPMVPFKGKRFCAIHQGIRRVQKMEFPWKIAGLQQNVLENQLWMQGMPEAGLLFLCVTGPGLSLAVFQHHV